MPIDPVQVFQDLDVFVVSRHTHPTREDRNYISRQTRTYSKLVNIIFGPCECDSFAGDNVSVFKIKRLRHLLEQEQRYSTKSPARQFPSSCSDIRVRG